MVAAESAAIAGDERTVSTSSSSSNAAAAAAFEKKDVTTVRVIVRVRPLLAHEKLKGCQDCMDIVSDVQMKMGTKAFTFDRVFGAQTPQHEIYDGMVSDLVEQLFKGYNATVLAYGQTGSGKTYTMGSASDGYVTDENAGIIPRAVNHIFDMVTARKESQPGSEFYLKAQFIEIYGEDIRDLLDPSGRAQVSLREGEHGAVEVYGANEADVRSTAETMQCLERGAICRTTAQTLMNVHSSRSHAIFSIVLEQHLPSESSGGSPEDDGEGEVRVAKFHFVDLAGSERAKRTGATGQRLREGININKGLLALGNVISLLGDVSRQSEKSLHVPYRNSKLTRFLQDSLGGNSRTLMLCCVSPADVNFTESMNALRYANRARNIKNKPIVNIGGSTEVKALKAQVAMLQRKLREQMMSGGDVDVQHSSAPSASSSLAAASASAYGGLAGNSWGGGAKQQEKIDELTCRALTAETEVKRLMGIVDREKRNRSSIQEQLIMAKAELEMLRETSGEGEGKVDGDAVERTAKYLREIEELKERLQEAQDVIEASQAELEARLMSGSGFDGMSGSIDESMLQAMMLDESDRRASLAKENSVLRRMSLGSSSLPPSPVSASASATPKSERGFGDDEDANEDISDPDADTDATQVAMRKKFEQTKSTNKTMVKNITQMLRCKVMEAQKYQSEATNFKALLEQMDRKMRLKHEEMVIAEKQRDELQKRIETMESAKPAKGGREERELAKLRTKLKEMNAKLKSYQKLGVEKKKYESLARSWEKKATQSLNAADSLKRQKVRYQKQFEEEQKKFRAEMLSRRKEICQLRKERRIMEKKKVKAEQSHEGTKRVLRERERRCKMMQEKIKKWQHCRNTQTEEQRKMRLTLKQRMKRELKQKEKMQEMQRNLELLERAQKKRRAIEKQLEEAKKELRTTRRKLDESELERQSAEIRSEAAQNAMIEAFAETRAAEKRIAEIVEQKQDSQQEEKESSDNQPTIVRVSAAATEEAKAAIVELQERLEETQAEVLFQEERIANASEAIADGENSGSSEEKLSEGKDDEDVSAFHFTTVAQANEVVAEIMKMWVESRETVKECKTELEQLRAEISEHNSMKEMHRRNALMRHIGTPPPSGAAPPMHNGKSAMKRTPVRTPVVVNAQAASSIIAFESPVRAAPPKSPAVPSSAVSALSAVSSGSAACALEIERLQTELSRRQAKGNDLGSPNVLRSPAISTLKGDGNSQNVFDRLTNVAQFTGTHRVKFMGKKRRGGGVVRTVSKADQFVEVDAMSATAASVMKSPGGFVVQESMTVDEAEEECAQKIGAATSEMALPGGWTVSDVASPTKGQRFARSTASSINKVTRPSRKAKKAAPKGFTASGDGLYLNSKYAGSSKDAASVKTARDARRAKVARKASGTPPPPPKSSSARERFASLASPQRQRSRAESA